MSGKMRTYGNPRKGVVHKEFVRRGQTVNGQFYLGVMKRLRAAVRRKRPEGWRNKTWTLHQGYAHEFLAKHETTLVSQPPYSPDLPLADYFVSEVEIHTEKVTDFRRKKR
jgi:transposase